MFDLIAYTFPKSGVNVTFDAACILGCSLPQVAIIAGNFDLAEIIKVHKSSDVGKFEHPSGAVAERAKKAASF